MSAPERMLASEKAAMHVAFAAALREVKKRHRGVSFAPQTVEAFAWDRFVSGGKPDQAFAEFLLVQEALLFEKARRSA